MDKVLAQALELRERGFAVHWLRPGEKIPVLVGWSDTPVMTTAELFNAYCPGYNVGFRAGRWSIVDGGEICVLDVDIRGGAAFAKEAYAAAESIAGDQLTVVSGSGVGRHYYVKFPIGTSPAKAATTLRQSDVWIDANGGVVPAGTAGARPAWLIELLSTGKNVVAPPSTHPDTGKPYEWATQ